MKSIVADSGPLITFARIKQFSILTKLFDKVFIPNAVARECTFDQSMPGADMIQKAISKGFLKVEFVTKNKLLKELLDGLDPGEAEALVLTKKLNTVILIDEKKGRNVAKKLGLSFIGTAGLLVAAKKEGHIKKIRPSFNKLLNVGFHLSDEIVKNVLLQAKEL